VAAFLEALAAHHPVGIVGDPIHNAVAPRHAARQQTFASRLSSAVVVRSETEPVAATSLSRVQQMLFMAPQGNHKADGGAMALDPTVRVPLGGR
jgi:hypothetical protein